MPLVNALPTWLAVNNANFSSPSGMADPVTGQPEYGGALNLGDYSDYTSAQAGTASYTTNGILYEGRYRYVQVDSSATAANVKTGTIGYLRAGGASGSVKSVVVLTQGSGQTVGTYQVAGVGGGGTGAIIQVVVSSATTISVSVVQGGNGYVAPPTFTLATGGTVGTVSAQLDTSPNVVTSYDQASNYSSLVRPVVFLNAITPGNYGFIQELGTATVLGKSSFTGSAAAGVVVQPTTGGVVDVPTSTTAVTNSSLGLAIDTPVAGQLFKIYLQYVPVVQD